MTLLRTCALLCLLAAFAGAAQPAVPPPLSLAETYRDDVDVSAYWVSEKLDGVRARWDGATLISRRGNRFNAPPWFVAGFPDVPLDGELWMGRGTFDALSGIVRRKTPHHDAWRAVRFMVFDLPAHDGDFDGRLRRMRELLAMVDSPYLDLIEQRRVANNEELLALLADVTAGSGEGLMLRRAGSFYRAGRNGDLLKLKLHEEAAATVVAHLPGKGRLAGMLGALLMEMPNGRRFRLGTGFTDDERRNPPPVGAVVIYKHHGKTNTGLPRFASFLRVRAASSRPPPPQHSASNDEP